MRLIIYITSLFFPFLNIYCQTINDIPPFNIVNTKWCFISKDLNFPENNKGIEFTPYSCRAKMKAIENGNFIYTLENTFTALKGFSGWDGFVVHKLNKENGEVEWIYQYNQHEGIKNFERPRPYIGINNDDNIEILTLRDRDTMVKDYPYHWEFIGTPALHVINAQNGVQVNYKYGKDTTKFDHTRLTSGAKLHYQEEGKYFSLLYTPVKEEGLTKDLFQFNRVNDSLNISMESFYTYKINTNLVTIYDNLGYVPIIDPLYNKDTLIILAGIVDEEDGFNSPKQAFLHWVDIKNLEDIIPIRVVEVTDAFARPQKNTFRYNPELIFKPGNIILKQVMQPNTKIPNKYFTWMRWFDNDGNVLGNFPYVNWLDTFYLSIEPIGVKNNKLYITGRYYNFEENIERYDILEIEPHTNQVKKVGEFLSYNHLNSFFRINIINSKFLENGDVYFDLSYRNKINNDLTYWYMASLVIKPENLGIISSNQQTNISNHWSQIYPNPATDEIYITFKNRVSADVIINDLTGNSVLRCSLDSEMEGKVDVSFLPAGIYYVTMTDKNGTIPAKTHKVVKL